MITVTQRNTKGNVQFLHTLTEKEFASKYRPSTVRELFSNYDIEFYSYKKYNNDWGIEFVHREFKHVAYNENGKLLPVEFLVGLSRYYHNGWANWYYSWRHGKWRRRESGPARRQGRKSNWHRGVRFRQRSFVSELKRIHAYDREEFVPKVRSKRDYALWEDPWWDDYPRQDYRNNNWKRYRKHQWKEKK